MKTKNGTVLAASFLALACASAALADPDMETAVVEMKKSLETKTGWRKECSIKVQHPTDVELNATKIINEYINERLGGSYLGDLFDVEAMVSHYIAKCLKPLKWEEDMDPNWEPAGEYTWEITRIAETEKYVTYEVSTFCALGDSKVGYNGMTFRKSDGRRMGWDAFVNTSDEGFKNLIKKGLKEFTSRGSDKELAEELLEYKELDVDDIPRPWASPLFTKEGVKLTYQIYEIMGNHGIPPSFVVPYAEIVPYMTRAARELVMP